MRCVIVVLVVFVAGVHVVHRGETNVNRHQPRSQEYHAIRFQPSSTTKRREEEDDDGTRRTMVIILYIAFRVRLCCNQLMWGTVLVENGGITSAVMYEVIRISYSCRYYTVVPSWH
uniref:Secreted protein n=1 Tax=Pseudo-nitzschia australis TaxID=44445 RepID=A0A7S4AEL0_9STRA